MLEQIWEINAAEGNYCGIEDFQIGRIPANLRPVCNEMRPNC